jgi:aldehyde dehydrogenase (NAD+)
MSQFANYIDGQWVEGASVSRNVNPSNLDDVIGEFAQADAEQTQRAISAARKAFAQWSLSTPQQRFDILDQAGSTILARKAELGRLLAREEGKTLPEAIGEVGRAGQIFKFFAGEALRLGGETVPSVRPGMTVEVTREPLGVIGLITPWNFPIAIPAWKIAPALAYGNTVVVKPADLVPGSTWELVKIIAEAGAPAGVINLVMGRGSVVGEALVSSPEVDALSFTGSVATGRAIGAKCFASGKKFQLEMGGKNPMVVLDDADLDVAIETCINGAFYSTGQRCTASSRLIVTEGIYERFIDGMKARMRALKVGDALADGTHIGPVVDDKQLRRGARRAGHARLLPRAGTGYRHDAGDAHQPGRSVRPGGLGHQGQGLQRGARSRQRHGIRTLRRHLHDLPEVLGSFPSACAGRHGDGEHGNRRRGLSRAIWRAQGFELRSARARQLCP